MTFYQQITCLESMFDKVEHIYGVTRDKYGIEKRINEGPDGPSSWVDFAEAAILFGEVRHV